MIRAAPAPIVNRAPPLHQRPAGIQLNNHKLTVHVLSPCSYHSDEEDRPPLREHSNHRPSQLSQSSSRRSKSSSQHSHRHSRHPADRSTGNMAKRKQTTAKKAASSATTNGRASRSKAKAPPIAPDPEDSDTTTVMEEEHQSRRNRRTLRGQPKNDADYQDEEDGFMTNLTHRTVRMMRTRP